MLSGALVAFCSPPGNMVLCLVGAGVAAYTAPDRGASALTLGSGEMPVGKQLMLQCLSRMCDDSSDTTASNVSVSCSSCAELQAAGCSASRCSASCTPDDTLAESPRVYVQISTGCSISTWSREFLTDLMEVHGVEVAAPAHARHEKHPTLDGSEVHKVLAMRDKVPGLKDMMDEPASASAAWLGAMAACTQEQGTALVVKISPSPMRLPLVALLAKQNTRFVVMERTQTLDYLLCMVRDCKKDQLTGILPPGTPATRALALRAGNGLQNDRGCFDDARKSDREVLARLDPQTLPAAVQGLLQRTGSQAAYLQQAGLTEKQRPSVIAVEDLTALEYDTTDNPYKAFNQSVGAWMEVLRSLSIAPDERKVRAALLPLAHTRKRTKPEKVVSNWADVEAQLHELGVVDSNGYSTRTREP